MKLVNSVRTIGICVAASSFLLGMAASASATSPLQQNSHYC